MAKRAIPIIAALGLLALMAAPVAAHDNGHGDRHRHHGPNDYLVTTLVADDGVAPVRADANLVNGGAWLPCPPARGGSPTTGPTSRPCTTAPVPRDPLVVNVDGGPTGLIANTTTDFSVTGGGVSGVARFIFATEDGTIRGWSPTVPAAGSTDTEIGADRSSVDAIYKGLATGTVDGKNYLYAADFHNGRIDVFDGTFTLQDWQHAFRDRVAAARLRAVQRPEPGRLDLRDLRQAGRRQGGRDRRTPSRASSTSSPRAATSPGRVASGGALNAPWGLAWAPADFGRFSGDLLVGNFGDGKIHAYAKTRHGWRFDGTLRDADHHAIAIDGLWALAFGNGSAAGPLNSLYFTAGPNDEKDGAFGSITAGN